MSHYILSNAALASILAVVVCLSSRIIRNASVVHILWVVVLLRFLAPPLVSIPMGFSLTGSESIVNATPDWSHGSSPSTTVDNVPLPEFKAARESGFGTSQLLAAIWAAGAIVVLALATTRALRLQTLVRRTGVGDERLQQQARRLSNEMGLRHTPKVLLVQARISPMVWAWFWRPVLLLPSELWSTLSDDEKTAVFKHELAHLFRRDHWVRVVEALATITHWWCPVLWWARRELHRYEERCCDGWAAYSGPESRAALARACLHTIDFIGRETPHGLHFGASRMAGFRSLRQRLQFILEGENMHTMTRRVNAAVILVLILMLGVSPGFGEASDQTSSDGEWKVISVPDTFESLRVIGGVDVAIQFGKSRKVLLGKTNGREPSFMVDDKKRLVITLDESRPKRAKENRPNVVVTTPRMAVIEAMTNAAVSVRKVKVGTMVVAVEGGARVSADGHCESLTVTADKSGLFLGKKMTATSAVVTASRKSAISLGKVRSLVQVSDATSKVDISGDNVDGVRLNISKP